MKNQSPNSTVNSTSLTVQLIKQGLLALLFTLILPIAVFGNGFNYSFANERDTIIGADTYYLADVLVANQAATPEKMGLGRIYFEYNQNAFGTLLGSNPDTEIQFNNSYLLGTIDANGFFQNYSYVHTLNDLVFTPNRFGVSWDQYIAEDCLLEEVTQVPRKLLGLKLKYLSGGTQFLPDLCFTTDSLYIDQVYTACGPFSGMTCDPGNTVADCQNDLGTQITLNSYDCGLTSSNELPDQAYAYTVFPNPTSDLLTIELEGGQETSYALFDLQGRLINEGIVTGSTTLDTKELAVGTYYLRLGVGVVEKVLVSR